jgi:hypothetical protein
MSRGAVGYTAANDSIAMLAGFAPWSRDAADTANT